jgi:hypothetical protein
MSKPARKSRVTRQLEILALRSLELADQVAAGQLKFIDAVDAAYEAAQWAGLVKSVGDDAGAGHTGRCVRKRDAAGMSMMAKPCAASRIKRRRAARNEMEERARFLIDYAAQHGPISVCGLYYQAEVAVISGIDKTESSYDKVQRQVLRLRQSGDLAYEGAAP